MEAIILAGGFGTRLKHIISDVPKPMAPINGEPFLSYLLDYLRKAGVSHVVLAVGYKHGAIVDFFGDYYQGIKITYSIEDTPLGTGGAIKKAIDCCQEEEIFVLNGDTFFEVDLMAMKDYHHKRESQLTIAVKALSHFDRYGSVIIENNVIKEFTEKKPTVYGKINAGIYLLKRTLLDSIEEESFSFEEKILQSDNKIYAFESTGYFIDIGVPEDYRQAQIDLGLYESEAGKVDE
ncbi:nucleotidyltransferase family protein [Dehalobacter sp. TeCB1]|uniref:nucleotidyltransferase family protein n=1 Tax=Dehalobacter sp. TeCB1 TaxID=1843715 RepID=UPI00083A51B3|nr:nucleotidyltransferase family protein [Dehalobacter sp. TeCB1]OCZ49444.1 D-glycero-D-manno-heptose 1-phosphate guanosyltransferase [Dehalobacter sp. TeCB1]